MHQILDQLLEASSERDMQRPFEEFSGEVEENASAALEGLPGGLFDAIAMVAPGSIDAVFGQRTCWSGSSESVRGRRRETVIRIFPNTDSVSRLVGALCAATHEEWRTGRRSLTMNAFFEWKAPPQTRELEAEKPTGPAPVAA
jgi:hypothetical protein